MKQKKMKAKIIQMNQHQTMQQHMTSIEIADISGEQHQKVMETVVNKYRVCVKKWCGSCEHREVDEEGTRICRKMQLVVQQKFVCPFWRLSSGLRNAGRSWGTVRHKDTKEIIIR